MKRISTKELSGVLLLAAVCIALKSQALGTLQITFDGPPIQPPGSAYTVTNYSEAGMSFAPIPPSYGFSRVGPGFPGDPQNGTEYLSAALTQSLKFRFDDGAIFGLISVDLAEYSGAFQEPLTVHFIGYRQDGSTIATDFITDGVIDGTGPLADFQTFYFDEKWVGLTRVEVPGYGWSLDNLVVSVPEPHIGLLSFAGGLLFWTLRRRKSATVQVL